MEDYTVLPFFGRVTPKALGMITGDFNICESEEGTFNVRNQTFTEGDTVKTALFRSVFPHELLNYTAADGTLRTLSRIHRAFIKVSMTEARDFHCYSHVSNNR